MKTTVRLVVVVLAALTMVAVLGRLSAVESLTKDQMLPGEAQCGANYVTQTFAGTTRWDLCFEAAQKFGLIIKLADFQTSPSSLFVRVLFDGRLGEIFVPYHDGDPRFGDISDFNFDLAILNTTDCPPPAILLAGGRVCREVRDRGLAWRGPGNVSRRGLELVLWASLIAGNYQYIMEWSFRDDGSIGVRAGSTGPKLQGPDDPTGHMHNFTWRLDVDLNGAGNDSVALTKHRELLLLGLDSEDQISFEGGFVWTPTAFTTLVIRDAELANGNGRPTTYSLVPSRRGTARHVEPFTQKDFWVTRFRDGQFLAKNLPSFVNFERVSNTDVVLWYTSSVHHENLMRDEDRQTVPTIWTGFELVPGNLFDRTPLFPE